MSISLITSWEQDIIPRYGSLRQLGSGTAVESIYTVPALAEVQGYLSGYVTTPFSDNNITARDLVVDMTYLKAGNLKVEEYDKLKSYLYERMDRIRNNEEKMLLDDGTELASVGETIYSSTEDYHPTFGMGDIEHFHVDSSQAYNEAWERNG